MSDCIDTVISLMPSSSNFQGSDVEQLLDKTIGTYFDSKEEDIEELIDASSLSEADGFYLDYLYGRLYGLQRLVDEDDDDYRQRLIFHSKNKLTIPDLLELGCGVYAYVDDFDKDYQLTSHNTGLTRKCMIEAPSTGVEDLVKNNIIWEKCAVFL